MDPRLQLRVQRYGWDRAAPVYDRAWRRQLAPAQELLLRKADLRSGEDVAELACGSGLVTREAARAVGQGGRVVATDLADRMVELTQEMAEEEGLQQVETRRMDAGSLDLPDASFDASLCALGLMYLPDPDPAMAEMARVLRPGGRAVAAVWGERKRCGWAEVFPIVDARVETDVCPLFFQLGTGETLRHRMEAAGLEDLDVTRIDSPIEYESADDVLEAAFAGGPVAMAYHRFDDDTRREVHDEYLASIEPYRTDDGGYRIPGEFVVARGRRSVTG